MGTIEETGLCIDAHRFCADYSEGYRTLLVLNPYTSNSTILSRLVFFDGISIDVNYLANHS